MNWFKSIWLTSEERDILKRAKLDRQNNNEVNAKVEFLMREVMNRPAKEAPSTKPYSKVIYDGAFIQVIFNDGSIFTKMDVDASLFKKVRDTKTEDEIYTLLASVVITPINDNEVDSPAEKALVMRNSDIFDESPDFEKKNGEIFFKGVELALPSIVATSFIEILEKLDMEEDKERVDVLLDQYHALKMFWLKLALNPIGQSREDLLIFVKKNNVRITRNGNVVLYRRIVSYGGKTDNKLTTFISQMYADRKRQKKSHTNPSNYTVLEVNGKLELWDGNTSKPKGATKMGNLADMYKNLPELESNIYTSAHNKGKMQIKIGDVYKIPDNEINLNNGLCAAGGLHAAAVDYNYSGFGDTPVVVLVNPSKAITVPRGETGKLRTTEMFIACVNNKPQGTHFDDGSLSAFDDEYHDFTLTELEKAVKNKTFTSLSVQGIAPAVSLVDLDAIKGLLKTRVKQIV